MIIFSDFDRTLYDYEDATVLTENLRAISAWRQAGNYFCVATGRNLASLKRILPECQQFFDFFVLDSGSFCLNPSQEVMFDFTVSRDTTNEVVKQIRNIDDNSETMFYHIFREALLPFDKNTKVRTWVTTNDQADIITKALQKDFNTEIKIYPVHNVIPTNKMISGKHHAFIDVVAKNSGKESAVRALSDHLGEDKIITIGDGVNDYDMIKEFDGYAVANSKDIILKMVKPPHLVNSVSELIYRFL